MNKNKTYISTQYTNQIQDYFNEVFPITLNDIEDTDASVIRNAMFAFFSFPFKLNFKQYTSSCLCKCSALC